MPVVSPDRNRWRTLLSVDDLVEGVVGALQEANVLDHTYVLYSSDHVSAAMVGLGCCCRDSDGVDRGCSLRKGFHIGQMRLGVVRGSLRATCWCS